MKQVLTLGLATALAGTAAAQGTVAVVTETPPAAEAVEVLVPPIVDAADVTLEEFQWVARPIVVFADTPADPRFIQQMELLAAQPAALIDRDVVIITDTDPAARSDIRIKLRPRGFMMTLIGKDGGVKLRKPFPWDVRELSRAIDKMPLRRQEIRDRNAGLTQ